MVAIIAWHALCDSAGIFHHPAMPGVTRSLGVWVKFGTIDFFIISGFLLGDTFQNGRPLAFLRRRVRKVLVPWTIWFVLMIVGMVAGRLLKLPIPFSFHAFGLEVVTAATRDTLFSTSFWFVPNLLISLCVLLLVRKHLQRWWLGCVFFLVTSFYVVNIYERWIPSQHTVAVGGFVFYLWLGALLSRRYEWIMKRAATIPMFVFVLLVATTGLISLEESNLLFRFGAPDPLNTLRLSNQIYSVAVILLVLKLRTEVWPRFVDVRNQTYGVYLSHSLVLAVVFFFAKQSLRNLPSLSGPQSVVSYTLLSLIFTVVVFGLCTAVTQMLTRRRLGWLIGNLSKERRTPPESMQVRLASGVHLTQSA